MCNMVLAVFHAFTILAYFATTGDMENNLLCLIIVQHYYPLNDPYSLRIELQSSIRCYLVSPVKHDVD